MEGLGMVEGGLGRRGLVVQVSRNLFSRYSVDETGQRALGDSPEKQLRREKLLKARDSRLEDNFFRWIAGN